jgi:hypothetical protein
LGKAKRDLKRLQFQFSIDYLKAIFSLFFGTVSYNKKGEARKINLYLDYEDALTLADDDVNENWEIYRERFLRGDFP